MPLTVPMLASKRFGRYVAYMLKPTDAKRDKKNAFGRHTMPAGQLYT